MKNFIDYVLKFYGHQGIYKDRFDPIVTREEVEAALKIRQANDDGFVGDSFDRELVRDIMLVQRGNTENLEYPVVAQWVNNKSKP